MKDLIKKQGDMLRKETGMNIKEENLNEENENAWTIIYKGLLSGFRNAKTKNLESVAKGVAFLIKTEYGRGALNDFLKLVKKNLK